MSPIKAAIDGLKAQLNAEKPPELSLQHFLKKELELSEKIEVLEDEIHETKTWYAQRMRDFEDKWDDLHRRRKD
eukprot:13247251-Alexandrium_andersonii.AAC.1